MSADDVLAKYQNISNNSFSRDEVGVLLSRANELNQCEQALSALRNNATRFGLCNMLNVLKSDERIDSLLRGVLAARRTPLPPTQGTYAYDVTIGEERSIILTYQAGGDWNWGEYEPEIWDKYSWQT